MIFLGKKAAGGSPPVGLNVVNFDGANDYISGLTWSSGDEFTAAICIEFDVNTGNQTLIEGPFSFYTFSENLAFYNDDIGFSQWSLPTAGTRLAIMLAVDFAGGMTGGRTMSCYVNGSEVFSSTSTSALTMSGPVGLFNDLSVQYFDGNAVEQGWWHKGTALDPATYYSSFFDGSNDPQTLASNGAVGGVTPDLFIKGDATAWNSGTDENSNSYTMNGAVT